MTFTAPACTAVQQSLYALTHVGADKTARPITNLDAYHLVGSRWSKFKDYDRVSIFQVVYADALQPVNLAIQIHFVFFQDIFVNFGCSRLINRFFPYNRVGKDILFPFLHFVYRNLGGRHSAAVVLIRVDDRKVGIGCQIGHIPNANIGIYF